VTLSAVDGGFLYQLAWGKDPLGLDEIEGRVISAREMLKKTHDKPFPYPLQWLELLQAPCCGDVMIGIDKYDFFWDKPWVITSHGGPSRDEVGTSLLAIGPPDPGAALDFGHFSLTPFAARRHQPIFGLSIKAGEKRIVYASSTPGRLTNYTRCLMAGADVLIVNTPFFEHREEESHLSVQEAITLKDEVGANKVILTHANHSNLPHDELEAYVAQFEGITVAYDSLTVEV
jgi:hypothetical protein